MTAEQAAAIDTPLPLGSGDVRVTLGDRLALRPGEVRHLPVALSPTGSIEVQVLLAVNDRQTPRSGVPVVLRNSAGHEVARAITDFDGYALFDGLGFGSWQVEAGAQTSAPIALSRAEPDANCFDIAPKYADVIWGISNTFATLPGIVVVHTIFGMPILTLLFRNYFTSLPEELFKAARIDDAGKRAHVQVELDGLRTLWEPLVVAQAELPALQSRSREVRRGAALLRGDEHDGSVAGHERRAGTLVAAGARPARGEQESRSQNRNQASHLSIVTCRER